MKRGVLTILMSGLALTAGLAAWPPVVPARAETPLLQTGLAQGATGEVPATRAKAAAAKAPARPADAGSASARPADIKKPEVRKTDTKSAPAFKPALTEEQALAFAREHHPELASLLDMLRGMDRKHYEDALRDLTRDIERLARGDRDTERYALSLELWKLDSRIRLDVARHRMSGASEFEASVRPLVQQRHDVRIRLLELDRRRSAERVARLDQELATLRARPEERTAQEITVLKKSVAGAARKGSDNKPKAAAVKPQSQPVAAGPPGS